MCVLRVPGLEVLVRQGERVISVPEHLTHIFFLNWSNLITAIDMQFDVLQVGND